MFGTIKTKCDEEWFNKMKVLNHDLIPFFLEKEKTYRALSVPEMMPISTHVGINFIILITIVPAYL
jgi:hypothetical protein